MSDNRFATELRKGYSCIKIQSEGGHPMAGTRKVIDCRNFPSETACTVAISGTEEEVLDLAVHHATTVHGEQNTPELREQIRSMLKDELEARAARA
jgi:predicted small metal-binding protein